MSRQAITEEQGIHKAWYEEAKRQTLKTLPAFMKKLSEDYNHDYGTVCHALAAAAVGAAWAMNASPGAQGGITGFQAGAVFWEFYRAWQGEEGPCRIIKYRDLLYPQMDDKFDKVLSKYSWDDLQAEARKLLAEREVVHPDVKVRWESIAAGKLPAGFVVGER